MAAVIARRALSDALALMGQVGARRGNASAPMLELRADQHGLAVLARGGDIAAEVMLAADVAAALRVHVPLLPLAPFVARLAADEVRLDLAANGAALAVRAGDAQATLPVALLPPESWEWPSEPPLAHCSAEALVRLLAVRYCAALAEYQMVLRGLLFEFGESALTVVASDGFRLASEALAVPCREQRTAVLPSKSAAVLARLLSRVTDEVALYADQARLYVAAPPYRLALSLIEGPYPEWRRVLPQQVALDVTLDVAPLLALLRRLVLFGDGMANRRVDLSFAGAQLVARCESAVGAAVEALTLPAPVNESLSVAFNGRYLIEALEAVPTPQVRLAFSGITSPTLVESVGQQHVAVVVPLRV